MTTDFSKPIMFPISLNFFTSLAHRDVFIYTYIFNKKHLFVYLFQGISLTKLVKTGMWISKMLNRPTQSKAARALAEKSCDVCSGKVELN